MVGRPRKAENRLSRWIDEHCSEGPGNQTARDRFAKLAEIDVSRVSQICRGHHRPGMTVAARIEKITNGAVPLQYWVSK